MEKLVHQIVDTLSSFPRPKNWVLKLLSLLFALFLWYFVVGEDKVDMNVTIPVEIVNLPRDLIISNQFKKQLEVTVSGQRSLIRGMTSQHISRTVDLSKASPGTVVIENSLDSISLPRGLSILRVQPSTLTLLLDRLIQKDLPIKSMLVGKVHKDFRLDSVTVEPASLKISGPESILAQEKILNTSPIDINGLDQSTVKQVSLALKPEIADLIGEPVVAVRFQISELIKKIEFSDIQLEFDHSRGRQTEMIYQLMPSTVTITAEFPQTFAEETKNLKDLFRARIIPETLRPGSSKQKILVEGPPQGKILSVSPESATLKISETKRLKIKP
ncbi:MAG: CdaR family protein [Desulfobulbales bacterium]|nr:CdaR family protein [Desulfobulbales bacterium]